MRVTIIRADGFVSVDGEGYRDLDLSVIPAGVGAVQWYGSGGEVEHVDAKGLVVANEAITDLGPYEPALAAWQERKAALTATEAEE